MSDPLLAWSHGGSFLATPGYPHPNSSTRVTRVAPSYSFSHTATTLLRVNASLTVENEAEGNEDAAKFITHLACKFKDELEMQKDCSVVHKQLASSGRFPFSPTGFAMHGLAKRDSTHQQAALIPCPLRTHQGRTYPLLIKISGKLSSE